MPERPTSPARPAVPAGVASPTRTGAALCAAEALALAGKRACLSHETAALALGVELLDPAASRITVPRNRSRLTIPGWVVVRSDVPAAELEAVDGHPVTGALRTILDLARVLTTQDAVVAADSALRQELIEPRDIATTLERVRGRGAAALRAVGTLADPLSGSVLETLVRLLLVTAGLAPVTQYVVRDGAQFVARVDFAWPAVRLAVEADGFAYHSDRAAYRRDRERLNQLERLGWRVLRFTWEDVHQRPEHVIALVQECLRHAAA